MFDPETLKFFYVNRGATEQVGYDEAALLQMHPYDIKPTMSEAQFRDMIAPLLRGERETLNFETLHRHCDGVDIPVEIMLQYVAPAGEQARFVAVVRDISERREVERLKSQFVSTVSHELRTPLTAIRGALGLLAGGVAGGLPEKAQELIGLANQNTTRLLALISDLLDMEKIEQGRLEFEMRSYAAMALVAQALATNRSYAEHYGVRYQLVATAPDAWLNVDANRMQQVLANLLSNAAKFSPPGAPVDVAVTAMGDWIRIAVADRGPGIPLAFQPKVFQRFAQADASDSRQKGGTGLGLAITRSIVEHMGGVIHFETGPGQGTTFYVDFPACAGGGAAIASA
jgi:PAS domain S-box-containing protein